jgi:cytosine/adenosine deaminase-related metal-dependent hydrolase
MKTLLRGGTVVSVDAVVGDFDRGDVLIEGGLIVEVAERIDAPDATVIDATDRIVMPGFVDNHRHTWQTALAASARTGLSPTTWWRSTARSGPATRPRTSTLATDAGSSISISPDVELKMGFGWPMTGQALAAGLRPTLSVDDTPAAGGDMFSTLRTAFAVQRGLDGGLRSRDLLEFITVDAARSCGIAATTGSITPGKEADVILLRADDLTVFPVTDPAATIVTASHPGLVDTVIVAGRVVKRDGVLVDIDLPALRSRLLESRNRIAAAAGVPLDGAWRPSKG